MLELFCNLIFNKTARQRQCKSCFVISYLIKQLDKDSVKSCFLLLFCNLLFNKIARQTEFKCCFLVWFFVMALNKTARERV